jgi:tetratricopeptide (TPR) repeat protein
MKNRLVLTLLAVGLTIQTTATAQAPTASQDELARADKEYDSGQYDKAVADYTEAIRLKPDDADAFNNRGIAYDQLKQYDKAIADLTEVIRLKPDFALAFNNRGNVYNELKQYDKAIADYTEAIRLKPDFAQALCNRGHTYDDLKQYDKAVTDYTEASASNPTMPMHSKIGHTCMKN